MKRILLFFMLIIVQGLIVFLVFSDGSITLLELFTIIVMSISIGCCILMLTKELKKRKNNIDTQQGS